MSNRADATTASAAPDTREEPEPRLRPHRLLLVRHGESTWNSERRIQGQLDPPLTPHGLGQAKLLAERLTGRRVAGFYCSDLARAHQTAEVLAQAVDVEPTLEPGLREVALGEWEGKTREELIGGWPGLWEQWTREPSWDIPPGGEGAQPFADRVTAALARMRERHPQGDVLCVTHGGVIQVAILNVVGRGSRGVFPFAIENCSLTIIQTTRSRTIVTSVNDTCHLS